MELGLEVWGNDYGRIEAACRHADDIGIELFAYGESPHDLNLECWTVLAALGKVTKRIRLGPVIANVIPQFRSAFLLGRHVETLDAITDGRAELRTGVGASTRHARPWWAPHGIDYPSYAERLADLESALAVWERQLRAHSGVRLTIAATGQRALGIAAAHADVWETSFCTPAEYRERSAIFANALERIGADRSVIRSLEIDGFVATSEADAARVISAARDARGGNEDLERVLDRALTGTPNQIADHLAHLERVGVQRVLVALHDPLDLDAITAVAEARSLLATNR